MLSISVQQKVRDTDKRAWQKMYIITIHEISKKGDRAKVIKHSILVNFSQDKKI